MKCWDKALLGDRIMVFHCSVQPTCLSNHSDQVVKTTAVREMKMYRKCHGKSCWGKMFIANFTFGAITRLLQTFCHHISADWIKLNQYTEWLGQKSFSLKVIVWTYTAPHSPDRLLSLDHENDSCVCILCVYCFIWFVFLYLSYSPIDGISAVVIVWRLGGKITHMSSFRSLLLVYSYACWRCG